MPFYIWVRKIQLRAAIFPACIATIPGGPLKYNWGHYLLELPCISNAFRGRSPGWF